MTDINDVSAVCANFCAFNPYCEAYYLQVRTT